MTAKAAIIELQPDDVVEWSSSSNGTTKTKRGYVLLIIPRDRGVWPAYLRQEFGVNYRDQFNDAAMGWGGSRNHESYVVVVKDKGKPRLYWPRVAALKKVEVSDD